MFVPVIWHQDLATLASHAKHRRIWAACRDVAIPARVCLSLSRGDLTVAGVMAHHSREYKRLKRETSAYQA